MTITETDKSTPGWRLWVPLMLQIALIATVPAQAIYTHLTGKTAILQMAPVDPYDLLRGYSIDLSYDISRPTNLKSLPGWNTLPKAPNRPEQIYLVEGSSLYVILQAPAQPGSGRPNSWSPVAVSRDRPTSLQLNQVAIKGRVRYGAIRYGLETYYMPESQRAEVNRNIQQNQGKKLGVVEVKVDAQGNAVPLTLWVGDRDYRF